MISSLDNNFIDSIIQKYGESLRKINLSNNGLRCLRNIEKLGGALKILDLSCNDLSDLAPISLLQHLEDLDLSQNNLSEGDLAPLANLSKLGKINLSGNNLKSFQSLTFLRNIPSLRTLSLKGNPFCSHKSYPSAVFQILSNVSTIDSWDCKDFSYFDDVDIGNGSIEDIEKIHVTSSSRILQHEREEQQSSSQEGSSDVIKVTHDDKKMKGKGLTEYKCVSDVVDEGMDVDREGGLGGDNSVPSNHRLQEKSMDDDIDMNVGSESDSDRVALLELQLKALKSVFAVQEKIFAENGFSAALHAQAQALQNQHQHHQYASSSSHGLQESRFDDQSTATSIIKQNKVMHSDKIISKTFKTVKLDSFPYLKLLELWRKKCVTMTVARLQAEKDLQGALRGLKECRSRDRLVCAQHSAVAIGWTDRLQILTETTEVLNRQLDTTRKDLEVMKRQRTFVESDSSQYKAALASMRESLEVWRVWADEEQLQGQVAIMKCLQRLGEQEERISRAAERISFAAATVAQKEISLRNSSAALDAQRRLLLLQYPSHSKRGKGTEPRKQGVKDKDGEGGLRNKDEEEERVEDALEVNSSKVHSDLAYVQLHPEAEALLRCVFRSLDQADSGYVSVTLLLKCLGQDGDEDEDEDEDEELEREEKGEREGEEGGRGHGKDNYDYDDDYGARGEGKKNEEEEEEDEEVEARKDKHRSVGTNNNNGSYGKIDSSSSRIQNNSDVNSNYNRNNYDNVIHEKNHTDNKRDCRKDAKKTRNKFNRKTSNIGNEVVLPHTDSEEDSLPRIVCVSMGPVLFCRLIKELKKTIERAKVTRHHSAWPLSNKPPTEIGKEVRKEVEKRCGEEEGVEVKLSWGEFLLLLIPDCDEDDDYPGTGMRVSGSRSKARGSITAKEMSSLREQKLLGDCMWGVIPLDLRNVPGNVPRNKMYPVTSPISITASKSTSPSSPEIKRLTHERMFLQERLQEMSRTLERRAEGIKAFFEDDLKKSRMRETRLKAQADSKNVALSLLEGRIAESEKTRKDHEDRMKLKIEILEQENAALISKAILRKSEEISLVESQLLNASNRYATLECEHNLTRRAFAKSEVRARGLERDVIRLQAALSAGINKSNTTEIGDEQAIIIDSFATLETDNGTSIDKMSNIDSLNSIVNNEMEKGGDASIEEQGKQLLLQRIEALEKALNRKEKENTVEKELQIPIVTANNTGIRARKKEKNIMCKKEVAVEVINKGNCDENDTASDTEEDEEIKDSEVEDRESSDDNDVGEAEEEGEEENEEEEEQRMIAIRNQLHKTREAWHAGQSSSVSQRQGQGRGQGQDQDTGQAVVPVLRDAHPIIMKSILTGSRMKSTLSSSSKISKEKEKNEGNDKIKNKDRNKSTKDNLITTSYSTTPKGMKTIKIKSGTDEGVISDIGYSGVSQTQDLYSAQLARLMSMAEEVISRK